MYGMCRTGEAHVRLLPINFLTSRTPIYVDSKIIKIGQETTEYIKNA